ncbi:MAG: hypothetical protein NC926_05990, partial [Candidatus Omnitrophica bacterium]|nr:hypothetical protein [Candidatus Omnitrophota bacterium]
MEKKTIKNLQLYLFIIFCTIFVYLNAILNPFIWDDFSLIVENTNIKNFKLLFHTFKKDIYFGVSTFYRPLQSLSYALIYKFFKLNPIPYHLLNIFLHIGCSILFF